MVGGGWWRSPLRLLGTESLLANGIYLETEKTKLFCPRAFLGRELGAWEGDETFIERDI